MTNNPRDTQFQGFAKLLYEEVINLPDRASGHYFTTEEFQEQQYTTIARCAYGLVEHVLTLVPQLISTLPDAQTVDEVIRLIPDMTEWPDKSLP